jgi:WD40 repeat protein
MNNQRWQHPFVDVFKFVNLKEWRVAQREGDVAECLDRTTGKRVYRVWGSVSAANYIQIPRNKGPLKSLALTGRYVYIQFHVPPGKFYAIHLDFILKNYKTQAEELLRLSLSNIFKANKYAGNSLQIPCKPSDKWTVVCVDVQDTLEAYVGSHLHSHVLRSVTLCSNLFVRGIFTSDILYNCRSLPREMMFKISPSEQWTNLYDWYDVPTPEDKQNLIQSKNKAQNNRKVTFKNGEKNREDEEWENQVQQYMNEITQNWEKEEAKQPVQDSKQNGKKKIEEKTSNQADIEFDDRKTVKQPKTELESLKSTQKLHLNTEYIKEDDKRVDKNEQGKQQTPRRVTFSDEIRCEESPIKHSEQPKQEYKDPMSVDPITELNCVIGFTGQYTSCVRWAKNPANFSTYPEDFREGTNKFIIYPSGSILVIMNPINRKQFFMNCHTGNICSISLSRDGALIASSQEGPNPLVLVWDIKSRRKPTYISIARFNKMKSVSFSHSNKYLATVGSDAKSRDVILIWDISGIAQGQMPSIFAKQISPFHINTIKYSPIEEHKLVSCGKENIRFWRVQNGHLNGAAVVLNHHARASEFLDLDFEYYSGTTVSQAADQMLKRVFVGNNQGLIFQVNYHNKELEGVFQIHDGAIHSVVVTEAFCVTGSQDTYLRIWPLDFSEYYLEAKHEADVTSVDVSGDGMLVVAGTLNCALGSLDMTNNSYRTLLRAHASPIVSIDVQPSSGLLLTIAQDFTMRVWNFQNGEEMYEFTSLQDEPTAISLHPTQPFFVCGFASGSVRLFHIETTSMREEFIQHETRVLKCAHSRDERLLLSASEDGLVCLYDARRRYQPVKSIPVEVLGDAVDACFSYDSKQFAVLGTNGSTIFIWDCYTFALKFRVNTSGAFVLKIAFSPNCQDIIALTKSNEYKVRYYGLNGFEGILIKELPGLHPNSTIESFDIAPNSKYLITAGTDRMLKIWDYSMRANDIHGQAFIGHAASIKNVIFSTDNQYIFTSSEGNEGMFVWKFNGDVTPLQIEHRICMQAPVKIIEESSIEGLLQAVQALPDNHTGKKFDLNSEIRHEEMFSVDQEHTTTKPNQVKFIDTAPSIRIQNSHSDTIFSIALSDKLATASCDGSIKIWNLASYNSELEFQLSPYYAVCVSFFPNTSWLAVCLSNGVITILNISSQTFPIKYELDSPVCYLHCISSDTFIAASITGKLELITVHSWEPFKATSKEFGYSGGQVTSLDYDECILVASDKAKIQVWNESLDLIDVFNVLENPHGDDIDTGENLSYTMKIFQEVSKSKCSAVFKRMSNLYLAIVESLQYLYIRDYIQNEVQTRIPLMQFPISLVLHPNIKLAAIGSSDGAVQIYNTEKETLQELEGQLSAIQCANCDETNLIVSSGCDLVIWRLG